LYAFLITMYDVCHFILLNSMAPIIISDEIKISVKINFTLLPLILPYWTTSERHTLGTKKSKLQYGVLKRKKPACAS
jgi:hypothetical protein